MRLLVLWIGILALVACSQSAEKSTRQKNCERINFESNSYVVCHFARASNNLGLFLKHPDGKPFGDFARLKTELEKSGKSLKFAMNAGMYHEDRRPVGLYVENGVKTGRLQKRASADNFGLLPNGVFWFDGTQAAVMRTLEFEKNFRTRALPKYATQSGPMLVIDGALHPSFKANSNSLNIRNGVGISADKSQVIFAISDGRVSFHTFARVFRDELKTPNALYLDGSVSKIFSTELGREDTGEEMGPIIAVVE
ncbi:MAG: putative lipoprotein [Hyphomonadaceae bacterium]|nr:MAG: putative lipoprotein [Hyphomonadaceae bacterium]KAF0186238.1 MAG: putative lipoprotein [Hyphomonadaceae bacterium]